MGHPEDTFASTAVRIYGLGMQSSLVADTVEPFSLITPAGVCLCVSVTASEPRPDQAIIPLRVATARAAPVVVSNCSSLACNESC